MGTDWAMHANQLLDHLSAQELRRLLPAGSQVPLRCGQALTEQCHPCRGLHFPMHGSICLVTQLADHAPLQLGMVGSEGVVGAQLLLGTGGSPLGALVQEGGEAWRLSSAALRRVLPESPGLHRLLARYLMVQMRNAATMAACLHFHSLQSRLARWLLMGQDRGEGEGVAVTHDVLAQRLGVRRVGVTVAAGSLQQAGLIRYRRGRVSILDREGLEAVACSCYAQDRSIYSQGMRFVPRALRPPR